VKLSDAIRKGSAQTIQCFGELWNLEKTEACAVGAAFLAINNETLDWPEAWVETLKRVPPCPSGQCDSGPSNPLVHLNDDHRWSRERIASFVALHESPVPAAREEKELVSA
jgi:hypothetical protein